MRLANALGVHENAIVSYNAGLRSLRESLKLRCERLACCTMIPQACLVSQLGGQQEHLRGDHVRLSSFWDVSADASSAREVTAR